MRYSIRKQFACIVFGLMAGTILLCWFINNTFLERYYFHNKRQVVTGAYAQLNEAARNGQIGTDDFDMRLQKLSARYNISVLVMDEDSETIRVSGGDPAVLRADLWLHILFDALGEGDQEERTAEPPAGGREGLGGLREDKTLESNESPFYILQLVTNSQMNVDYLDMWGFLDNGNLFFIRTALEGIRDSVEIANRFLAYVGLAASLASGILIWMVSKKVTDPILELAHISERMAHLDFDARYQGKSFNETAILGNHMNEMADALETTISELKTANNELLRDIEKKTEIDEMRKEFLANVSHELKTPLALIQGYAEGLKEGVSEDAESREFYCDVIMDEADKMNRLVKKLLTLNQLESGGEVISMGRFDVAALIGNYIQSADILIRQSGGTVRFEETAPVYVWGDEFKTEEVVMNYISNALNHLSGEKIVDIKLERREKLVRICVFNTGEPIPEDALPHLWEKFYKVDKARTREYGGSGVGLSIVKAIQESMNQGYGVVNYTNGVEFWFEMELVESAPSGVQK